MQLVSVWIGCWPSEPWAAAPDVAGGPEVVLRATDDGLIHATRDGGSTWVAPAGLPLAKSVRRLLKTSDGSETILLLANVGSGAATSFRVYRSVDRAQSFQSVYDMGSYPGDLWASRVGGGPIYLFNTGLLYRSDDGGATWNWTFASFPVGTVRAELAGSEAGAPRLWLIVEVSPGEFELHRSDDAGFHWSFVTDVDDYWGSLNASIVNPDLFAWGGVEVHRTANGGASFAVVNSWSEYYGQEATKLHADVPGLEVIPGGSGGSGETWYVATDGGLYRSHDGLASVENLSLEGLRVSQYYSTLTSSANPEHVAAGAQDQGYQWADQAPSGGTSVLDFDQLISGDYGHLTSGDGSHAYVFSVYPTFVLVHRGENTPTLKQLAFPPDETRAWLPPVSADTFDNRNFFLCTSRLWYYERQNPLNNWTFSLWSTFDFGQSPGEYVSALEFSPVDPNRAFATTNYGRLFCSNDRGVNWVESSSSGPGGQYFYGTAMHASRLDADVVWVAGSGYGEPAVYRSTDGGASYQAFGEGLPDTLVYCLGESPDTAGPSAGALFCGTETGVYRRDPSWPAWFEVTGNAAPANTYWSVEALPSSNALRFATYGRGIWDYALDETCTWDVLGADLGGAHVLELDSSTSTQTGALQSFALRGGEPGSNGYLLWSFALGFTPALGGTLLVEPANLLPITADANGDYDLSLFIDTGLGGIPFVLQGVLYDSTSSAWRFSNALRGTFCD